MIDYVWDMLIPQIRQSYLIIFATFFILFTGCKNVKEYNVINGDSTSMSLKLGSQDQWKLDTHKVKNGCWIVFKDSSYKDTLSMSNVKNNYREGLQMSWDENLGYISSFSMWKDGDPFGIDIDVVCLFSESEGDGIDEDSVYVEMYGSYFVQNSYGFDAVDEWVENIMLKKSNYKELLRQYLYRKKRKEDEKERSIIE